jgi:hypothetical protein
MVDLGELEVDDFALRGAVSLQVPSDAAHVPSSLSAGAR